MLLRPLTVQDEDLAVRAQELMVAEGFSFLFNFKPGDDFAAYVKRLDAFNAGEVIRKGGVPGRFLVAEVEGQLVGRLSLRYALNDFLRLYGGHIGYCVLPEFRRRGHATEMLREGLECLQARGVAPVLVTCDDDNLASIAVIEKAGGLYVDTVPGEEPAETRRYHFGETGPALR